MPANSNPSDPVVLIPNHPLEHVDREVGQRIRERVKQVKTGPHAAAPVRNRVSPSQPPTRVPT